MHDEGRRNYGMCVRRSVSGETRIILTATATFRGSPRSSLSGEGRGGEVAINGFVGGGFCDGVCLVCCLILMSKGIWVSI